MRPMHRFTLALILMVPLLAGHPVPAAEAKGVVNINTAGIEQLKLLPRVGDAVAERIVEFREKNGRFKSPEELMLVRGIGEATFQLIEPHITLSGETSLSEKVPVGKKTAEKSASAKKD